MERVLGFHDYRPKQAMAGLLARIAVAMKIVGPLLLVVFHHPFVGHRCAGKSHRLRVGCHCRSATIGHVLRRTVEVQTGSLSVFQSVAKGEPQAITLIDPQSQWLDGVSLQSN